MIELKKPIIEYFVNLCLHAGGAVIPINYTDHDPMWPGYCNPSIMWDDQDHVFRMVLRNVNYVMHASNRPDRNWCGWGPLFYSNPESDGRNLKTRNFMGVSDDPFKKDFEFTLIPTTPYTPVWEFQGLEDARLVRWDDLVVAGVRRDDNTTGRGSMEMTILGSEYNQHKIIKIDHPDENTYCEKNWMPISDMPNHFIQYTNPTRIYKVNDDGSVVLVVDKPGLDLPYGINGYADLRGSSQCIPFRGGHLALVHTCELWMTGNDRKFARYNHVLVYWDEDWNITYISPTFSFNNYMIEFSCGMTSHDGNLYISFALQDNIPYVVRMPESFIWNLLRSGEDVTPTFINTSMAPYAHHQGETRLFDPNTPADMVADMAMMAYRHGLYAKTYCILQNLLNQEDNPGHPEFRFMMTRALADIGRRDSHELAMWMRFIEVYPNCPDGWMALAMYYHHRSAAMEASFHASRAMECFNTGNPLIYYKPESFMVYYNECIWNSPAYESADMWLHTHTGSDIHTDKKIF